MVWKYMREYKVINYNKEITLSLSFHFCLSREILKEETALRSQEKKILRTSKSSAMEHTGKCITAQNTSKLII